MPSFHKIKIVKEFKKKIKFIKKKSLTDIKNIEQTTQVVPDEQINTSEIISREEKTTQEIVSNEQLDTVNDITVNELSENSPDITKIENDSNIENLRISEGISLTINEKEEVKSNLYDIGNDSNSESDSDNDIGIENIEGNHYIGLILIHSISVNNLHNMSWTADHHTNSTIFLNNTYIYVKKQNLYPIYEIDPIILNETFKYKKHIRNLIYEKFSIKKKDILNIKLYNTYGRLHNYIVILNSPKLIDNGLSSINIPSGSNKYSWRTRIDLFKKPLNNNPKQNEIYECILNNIDFKVDKKFNLFSDINDNIPNYIKYNKISYIKILKILSKIDFGY